jgi:hypothetical protein
MRARRGQAADLVEVGVAQHAGDSGAAQRRGGGFAREQREQQEELRHRAGRAGDEGATMPESAGAQKARAGAPSR